MRFISSGTFCYIGGQVSYEKLPKGRFISQMVLWTDTEHLGTLEALEEARVLELNASEFSDVVAQHKEAYMHAIRYAKHFVWRLNEEEVVDDLTDFEGLTLDVINEDLFEGTSTDHFVFISHYKVEAGTEATLLRDLMEKTMRDESHPATNLRSPIFIDSEDLADLARLVEHVQKTEVLMVVLTPGIFSRPWCLLEIVTAVKHNALFVPVEIQRPGSQYKYPDEEFYKTLVDGNYLPQASVDLLASEGVSLKEVESSIRQVFRKIALPFSPHKTKAIREAEVSNILKRCDSELAELEGLLSTQPDSEGQS